MDKILNTLQGKSFHLSKKAYNFLSERYDTLISIPFHSTSLRATHPETLEKIIALHRNQFNTAEYVKSRIDNPSSGTIDHLHAEIAANYAFRLGKINNMPVNALALVQTAAHMHDIDRSYPVRMIRGEEELRHDPAGYQIFKKKHAENSVIITKGIAAKIREKGFTIAKNLIEELCLFNNPA